MKEKNIKKYIKVFGKCLSVVSIAFIGYSIYKLGFSFNEIGDIKGFLIVCFIGVLIKAVTVTVSGSAWAEWLAFFSEKKFDKIEAVKIYCKANIGKYLPGNVAHYVERNLFATSLGVSQKRIAFSSFIEVVELCSTALILSLIFSANGLSAALNGVNEELVSNGKSLFLIAAITFLIAGGVYTIVHREKVKNLISKIEVKRLLITVLITMLYYSIVLVLLGAIMVLLYGYLDKSIPNWKVAAQIIVGYVIAWVVGFIVPGASGGIGVREMVLTLLLESVVGKSGILTLSVVHRLITIIGDLLVYLIVYITMAKEGKTNARC